MKRILIPVGLVLGLLTSTAASASSVTFGFTNGSHSATALFQNSGNNLVVTLTNTSSTDAMVPTDLLMAIFFDVSGTPALTALSANMCATCTVLHPPATPNDPAPYGVGGEWAYLGGATTLAFGGNYGISGTGLGVFGPGDRFPGADLDPPASLAGSEYGITTAGDNPATGNGGINVPLVRNQIVFTLGGFGSADVFSAISNVTFLYGTALDEPHYTGTCVGGCTQITEVATPEPASMVLLGSSLLGGYAARRRRKHAGTNV